MTRDELKMVGAVIVVMAAFFIAVAHLPEVLGGFISAVRANIK